jgi:hypothetical protein
LFAFAIDAWWGESQQRKHLRSVLAGLEAAFSENVTLLDENIELVIRYQGILKGFIEMAPGDAAKIPPELTFDTLQSIWRPVTTVNNHSLLIETLDSENLTALELPALQDSIARWRAQINVLNERTEQLVTSEHEALLVLGRYPEIAWSGHKQNSTRAS